MKQIVATLACILFVPACSTFPGHIPPAPRHAFEPRLHVNSNVPLLDQREWDEIKSQFAVHTTYRMDVAMRESLNRVAVYLIANAEPNKGRVVIFQKDGGRWLKVKDDESRIDY